MSATDTSLGSQKTELMCWRRNVVRNSMKEYSAGCSSKQLVRGKGVSVRVVKMLKLYFIILHILLQYYISKHILSYYLAS